MDQSHHELAIIGRKETVSRQYSKEPWLAMQKHMTVLSVYYHQLSGIPCSPMAQARIEDVADAIAEEVQG